MAYVYIHKRPDTGEWFYVGISNAAKSKYSRQKSRTRSNEWREFVSVYGFVSEVIHDKITFEEACRIEKELVLVYGRIRYGGVLLNKATGGQFCPSNYAAHNKGKKMPNHQYVEMMSRIEDVKTPVAKYDLDGFLIRRYNSMIEAAKDNSLNQGNITNACRKKIMYGNFMWRYASGAILTKIEPYKPRTVPVIQKKLNGEFVAEYPSAKGAARITGFQKSSILRAAKGLYKQAYGFKWGFKK